VRRARARAATVRGVVRAVGGWNGGRSGFPVRLDARRTSCGYARLRPRSPRAADPKPPDLLFSSCRGPVETRSPRPPTGQGGASGTYSFRPESVDSDGTRVSLEDPGRTSRSRTRAAAASRCVSNCPISTWWADDAVVSDRTRNAYPRPVAASRLSRRRAAVGRSGNGPTAMAHRDGSPADPAAVSSGPGPVDSAGDAPSSGRPSVGTRARIESADAGPPSDPLLPARAVSAGAVCATTESPDTASSGGGAGIATSIARALRLCGVSGYCVVRSRSILRAGLSESAAGAATESAASGAGDAFNESALGGLADVARESVALPPSATPSVSPEARGRAASAALVSDRDVSAAPPARDGPASIGDGDPPPAGSAGASLAASWCVSVATESIDRSTRRGTRSTRERDGVCGEEPAFCGVRASPERASGAAVVSDRAAVSPPPCGSLRGAGVAPVDSRFAPSPATDAGFDSGNGSVATSESV